MFFLTKLAGAALKPLSLILLMLLVGLLLAGLAWGRPQQRRIGLSLIGLATLALALIAWWPISARLIESLEQQYPAMTAEALPNNVSAIIVLGGGGSEDSTIPLTSQLGQSSLQRLAEGVRLWRLRPEARLVTSGSSASGRAQALIAADLAAALGVPPESIEPMPEPRNTLEEAASFAELQTLLALQGPVLLVSSASHLPRAVKIFEQAGVAVIPAPTGHRAIARDLNRPGDFAPSAESLRTTEAAWHEYLGRLWLWLLQTYAKLTE